MSRKPISTQLFALPAQFFGRRNQGRRKRQEISATNYSCDNGMGLVDRRWRGRPRKLEPGYGAEPGRVHGRGEKVQSGWITGSHEPEARGIAHEWPEWPTASAAFALTGWPASRCSFSCKRRLISLTNSNNFCGSCSSAALAHKCCQRSLVSPFMEWKALAVYSFLVPNAPKVKYYIYDYMTSYDHKKKTEPKPNHVADLLFP